MGGESGGSEKTIIDLRSSKDDCMIFKTILSPLGTPIPRNCG